MRFEQMAKTELGDSSRWREIMARVPQVGEPSDIGAMAAFLASDRAAKTTGCTLTVDGGVKDAFPR